MVSRADASKATSALSYQEKEFGRHNAQPTKCWLACFNERVIESVYDRMSTQIDQILLVSIVTY